MGKLITASVVTGNPNLYNIVNGNEYGLSLDESSPYRTFTYYIGGNSEYDIVLLSYLNQYKSNHFTWYDDSILLIAPFAYGYKLGTTGSGWTGSTSESITYTYISGIPFTKWRLNYNNKPVRSTSFVGGYSGTFYYISIPGIDKRIIEPSRNNGQYKYFSRLFIVPSGGYWDGGSSLPWKFNISAFSNTSTPGGSYYFAIVYYEMLFKNVTTGETKSFKSWMMANSYSQRFTGTRLTSNDTITGGGQVYTLPAIGYSHTIQYSIKLLDWQYDNSLVPEPLNKIVATNAQFTTASYGTLDNWVEYSLSGGEAGTYYLAWDFHLDYTAPSWKIEIIYYVKSDPDHAQDDRVVYDRNGGYKYLLNAAMSSYSAPGSTITIDDMRFPWPYRDSPREFTIMFTDIIITCSSSMLSSWGFTKSYYTYKWEGGTSTPNAEITRTIYQYMHSKSGYPWSLTLPGTYNNKTIVICYKGHG